MDEKRELASVENIRISQFEVTICDRKYITRDVGIFVIIERSRGYGRY